MAVNRKGRGDPLSGYGLTPEKAAVIAAHADKMGIGRVDLASIISFETVRSFSTSRWGGDGGQYLSLIQFSPDLQDKWKIRPGESFEKHMGHVQKYFEMAFRKAKMPLQGARLEHLYAAVLAGNPRAIHAADSLGTTAHNAAIGDRNGPMNGHYRLAQMAMNRYVPGDPPAIPTPQEEAPSRYTASPKIKQRIAGTLQADQRGGSQNQKRATRTAGRGRYAGIQTASAEPRAPRRQRMVMVQDEWGNPYPISRRVYNHILAERRAAANRYTSNGFIF